MQFDNFGLWGEFSARKIEFTKGRAVRGGGSIYIISGSIVNYRPTYTEHCEIFG